jgi:hypothetical protein
VENRKVIVRNFYRTKKLTTFETFENSQHENLSEILFPDKAKNLHGLTLLIIQGLSDFVVNRQGKIQSQWNEYLETVAKKLNATLKFVTIEINEIDHLQWLYLMDAKVNMLQKSGKIDFLLNSMYNSYALESYNNLEICFLIPLPPKYSIYELILILPLDKSCWLLLGVTVAISALIWRFFEGSGAQWNLIFGVYAYFLGQSTNIKV